MSQINEDLNHYKVAYESAFKYNDENHAMLQWYASRLITKSLEFESLDLLSFGIGHGTVSRMIIEKLNAKIGRYVIIEGSKDIIEQYIAEITPDKRIELIQSYFENYTDDQLFDIIEMGFILEHVEDPQLIISKYRNILKAEGSIFIAVPNAKSLHRLIGYEAGLLGDIYQLSEYDLQLGHKRYFDIDSIVKLVENCGLSITSIEGLFLKPITTDQIKKLHLSDEIMQAFFKIGKMYPEISNAILIEAKNR